MKRSPSIAEDCQRTPSVHLREQNVEDLGNKGSIWGGCCFVTRALFPEYRDIERIVKQEQGITYPLSSKSQSGSRVSMRMSTGEVRDRAICVAKRCTSRKVVWVGSSPISDLTLRRTT